MTRKRNIYDDASLIRKSLTKDLSGEEQKELDHLLGNESLRKVCEEVGDTGYLKSRFMEYEKYSSKRAYAVFKERRGHSRRILSLIHI